MVKIFNMYIRYWEMTMNLKIFYSLKYWTNACTDTDQSEYTSDVALEQALGVFESWSSLGRDGITVVERTLEELVGVTVYQEVWKYFEDKQL